MIRSCLWSIVIAMLVVPPQCLAGHRCAAVVVQHHAQAVIANVVAVPYAVPVGTPSFVSYSQPYGYGGGASAPVAANKPYEQYAAEYRLYLELRRGYLGLQASPSGVPDGATAPAPRGPDAASANTSSAPTLAAACASCHRDQAGRVDVSAVGSLTCDQKLDAVRRLLLPPSDPDHMPKGKTLSPEQIGQAIGELSGAAK